MPHLHMMLMLSIVLLPLNDVAPIPHAIEELDKQYMLAESDHSSLSYPVQPYNANLFLHGCVSIVLYKVIQPTEKTHIVSV